MAKKIRSGDRAAREKLVLSNLRFVVSVAKQYQNHGLTLGDLINEGNVGLIKAAECFDETKGFKFISYAVWWIRQSILQAIAENARLIRLPLNKISTINKVNRCYTLLEQEFQREPTEEEIAEAYEKNTGVLIADEFERMKIDYVATPAVLCKNHGPFTWGKSANEAVHNAVVLEEVAKMAARCEMLNSQNTPAPQELQDKHYYRKHGANAYYGQSEK